MLLIMRDSDSVLANVTECSYGLEVKSRKSNSLAIEFFRIYASDEIIACSPMSSPVSFTRACFHAHFAHSIIRTIATAPHNTASNVAALHLRPALPPLALAVAASHTSLWLNTPRQHNHHPPATASRRELSRGSTYVPKTSRTSVRAIRWISVRVAINEASLRHIFFRFSPDSEELVL